MMLVEADALGPQCGPFCGVGGGFDLVERCYNMGQ